MNLKRHMLALLLLLALGLQTSTAFAALCEKGDQAKVLWKGTWYAATVTDVDSESDQCFIHYTGYDNSWDEWVGADRIQILEASSPGKASQYKTGQAVEVNWKGTWYPAKILSAKGGRYKIHYEGYNSSWDEWVGPERIR